MYETYKEWYRLQLKFPKTQRYSLGDKISNHLISTLEYILEAAVSREKDTKRLAITKAGNKLDVTKILVRLAKDCECLTNEEYQAIESRLYEAGKMIGGWIKSLTEKKG